MSEQQIEIRTAHFEGNHTSHDWQPYTVEVMRQTAATITVKCSRLIEGRKRASNGTYRLRKDQVRGI